MSDFKGTKGKWKVVHSQSKNAFNVVGTVLGGRHKICRCPYLVSVREELADFNKKEKIEQNANAILISKAPEMLELLQKIVRIYDDDFGNIPIKDIEELIKEATNV